MKKVFRGEIFDIDLGVNIGSEVNKIRPCLIIQNDIGNKYSPTTIVAPISHRGEKGKTLPTQIELDEEKIIEKEEELGGFILLEQIRTIDKRRIVSGKLGRLLPEAMDEVRDAIVISLGL